MSEFGHRLISIDIEPGGASAPIGSIGVAEVVGTDLVSEFQMDYSNNLSRDRNRRSFNSIPSWNGIAPLNRLAFYFLK
jgi:hypothetical protein